MDPNYINIGDSSLITQRSDYPVGIKPPGGFLGEFIPFYFAGHSPMLLNIKTGYRGITQYPQEEIVFICCRINDIVYQCGDWCFTDGHAKNSITRFYNHLAHLDQIDWTAVSLQKWNDCEEDWDRQRKKQAEFLVKDFIPASCIHSIIVRNQKTKTFFEQKISNLELAIPVYIDTNNKLFYP